jgi:hypothetical protein
MSADGTYKLKPTALAAEPSFQCKLDKSFDSPVDSIEDGGEMVSGFFTPPDSGMYEFSLVADDGGILYFGESEASKTKIASVKSFLGTNAPGTSYSSQESTHKFWTETQREARSVSEPISLVGGKKYYIAAVEVNRQGRDALSVAVKGGGWNPNAPVPVTFGGKTILSHPSAADETLPVCPARVCETIQVGPGPLLDHEIDIGNALLKCPQTVSKENWLGEATYSDTFKITQTDNKITVVRSDTGNEADGWGMNLQFKCC